MNIQQSKSNDERRTRYLINRGFQFRYMGIFVLAGVITSLVIGGALYYLVEMNAFVLLQKGLEQFPDAKEFMIFERNIILVIFLGCFIVLSGLLSLWALFLSHRIAGPVYAFARRINQVIANRDLHSPLVLRKKDTLLEVRDFLNETLKAIEDQILSEKLELDQLTSHFENKRESYEPYNGHFRNILRSLAFLKKEKELWLGL